MLSLSIIPRTFNTDTFAEFEKYPYAVRGKKRSHLIVNGTVLPFWNTDINAIVAIAIAAGPPSERDLLDIDVHTDDHLNKYEIPIKHYKKLLHPILRDDIIRYCGITSSDIKIPNNIIKSSRGDGFQRVFAAKPEYIERYSKLIMNLCPS